VVAVSSELPSRPTVAPAATPIPSSEPAAIPLTTAPKPSGLKPTFAIPSSLGQTKKLGEIKNQEEESLVADVVEEPSYTPAAPVQELVLTQELLNQAIFSIQDVYRTANKNLELTLLDQDIQVKEGEMILLVTGSIQEDIALKMKPELVGLVRKFTGSTTFSITITQQEEIPDEKGKLYTSTDKLKFLREKHPALMELQRKFDLDVDF
jgi:hypothetical protein